MARDTPVVEETTAFGRLLEGRAQKLVAERQNFWASGESDEVLREMRLTLDMIERRRMLEESLRGQLSREQFYTYRELVQQKRETQYRPFRPSSIDQLKGKLGQIERERRSLALSHEEVFSRFHDRLLYQLQKLEGAS